MRAMAATATVVVGVLGMAAPSAVGAPTDGLRGTWTSTDTDGSHQVMTITGSPRGELTLHLHDDAGTVCGGDPARFTGHGRADGDRLEAVGVVVCVPGGNQFGRIPVQVSYLPATDQLTEPSGVVWTRE